jgi:hypothetical protein
MKRNKLDLAELQNREKTLYQLKATTKERLAKLRFEQVAMPERLLDIPLDITRVDNRTLGRVFSLSIAWENYAGDQLAYSRVASMLADYSYELVLAKIIKREQGGIQQRKAEALTSPYVRHAKLAVLECASRVILLESQFSRYTRISQALSREQTRREKLSGD